jgi:hypothetical protein
VVEAKVLMYLQVMVEKVGVLLARLELAVLMGIMMYNLTQLLLFREQVITLVLVEVEHPAVVMLGVKVDLE